MPRGGDERKDRNQPLAIGHTPSAALQGAVEAQREAMPIACGQGFNVCRMLGAGGGAPIGDRNALKHGQFTREAIAKRRDLAELVRSARRLVNII
jgi:hypothetical protein